MENKETIEDAAERLYPNGCDGTDRSAEIYRRIFIDGAKWQAERMYSEEDMEEYAEFCIRCYQKELPCIIAKDWFEQFKKTKDGK
jgi:hypothetical protein